MAFAVQNFVRLGLAVQTGLISTPEPQEQFNQIAGTTRVGTETLHPVQPCRTLWSPPPRRGQTLTGIGYSIWQVARCTLRYV